MISLSYRVGNLRYLLPAHAVRDGVSGVAALRLHDAGQAAPEAPGEDGALLAAGAHGVRLGRTRARHHRVQEDVAEVGGGGRRLALAVVVVVVVAHLAHVERVELDATLDLTHLGKKCKKCNYTRYSTTAVFCKAVMFDQVLLYYKPHHLLLASAHVHPLVGPRRPVVHHLLILHHPPGVVDQAGVVGVRLARVKAVLVRPPTTLVEVVVVVEAAVAVLKDSGVMYPTQCLQQ